jgi:TatD DNase family protein
VVETAGVLAKTRAVSSDEIARQTSENFFRLFHKVPRASAGAEPLARAPGLTAHTA